VNKKPFWIRKSHLNRVRAECEKAANVGLMEACGVFQISCENEITIRLLRNRSTERRACYLNLSDFKFTRRWSRWGHFHSHPLGPAKPSKSDLSVFSICEYLLLYNDLFDDLRLWVFERGQPVELKIRVHNASKIQKKSGAHKN